MAQHLLIARAAARFGVGRASLRTAAEQGRVRYVETRLHGRGVVYLFDEEELRADLEQLPRCIAPGCVEPGIGPSGRCGVHFRYGVLDSARNAERAALAQKRDWCDISEAAAAAAVNRATIAKAIKRRELPAEHIGRRTRIPSRALALWIAARPPRVAPAAKPTDAQRAARRARVAKYHAAGKTPGWIADTLACSKHTVHDDLRVLGLSRPGEGRAARTLPADERRQRQQRAADLYAAGHSLAEVAQLNASSATQVRRDLEALRVAIRPRRRKAKHPPASERACEWCKEPFTPAFPAHGHYRFCCDEHARDARAQAVRDALIERGLLSVAELATRHGVIEHAVHDYISKGWLKTELISVAGCLRPVHGITEAETLRFARWWAKGTDGRRRVWEDAEKVLARRERDGSIARLAGEHGGDVEAARDVLRGRVNRKARYLAARRRGRNKSPAPPERYLRWSDTFRLFHEELTLRSRENRRAVSQLTAARGLTATEARAELVLDERDTADPSAYYVAQAVAELDWQEHPEDWPRDKYPPARGDTQALDSRFASQAAKRVLTGIKRLQTEYTEIRAA